MNTTFTYTYEFVCVFSVCIHVRCIECIMDVCSDMCSDVHIHVVVCAMDVCLRVCLISFQNRSNRGQSPNRLSAALPASRKSWVELTQESSILEQEIESIQTRRAEIAEQKQELAGASIVMGSVVSSTTTCTCVFGTAADYKVNLCIP